MKEINASQLAMWKTVLGMLHADGSFEENEVNWYKEKLKALNLNEQQQAEFSKIIQDGFSPRQIWGEITEARDRGFVVYLARLAAHSDGVFHDNEKSYLEDLEKEMSGGVDIEACAAEVQRLEDASNHPDNVWKVHNEHSFFESAIKLFLRNIF